MVSLFYSFGVFLFTVAFTTGSFARQVQEDRCPPADFVQQDLVTKYSDLMSKNPKVSKGQFLNLLLSNTSNGDKFGLIAFNIDPKDLQKVTLQKVPPFLKTSMRAATGYLKTSPYKILCVYNTGKEPEYAMFALVVSPQLAQRSQKSSSVERQ